MNNPLLGLVLLIIHQDFPRSMDYRENIDLARFYPVYDPVFPFDYFSNLVEADLRNLSARHRKLAHLL